MLRDPRAERARDEFRRPVAATCATSRPPRPIRGMFPDFDENLREAMRRETELLFESVVRDDRSVVDLLSAELHVPQRAARPALRHSQRGRRSLQARRVAGRQPRGGLLGQGSILTLTSYATRTSPVRRGKWILETFSACRRLRRRRTCRRCRNETGGHALTMRERMVQHRADPACAAAIS